MPSLLFPETAYKLQIISTIKYRGKKGRLHIVICYHLTSANMNNNTDIFCKYTLFRM